MKKGQVSQKIISILKFLFVTLESQKSNQRLFTNFFGDNANKKTKKNHTFPEVQKKPLK